MRTVPARPTLVTVASFCGAFAAGPVLGHALAARLAPASELAAAASSFAFALAFALGLALWFGLGLFSAIRSTLAGLRRGRARTALAAPSETLVPPGYGAFVALSLLLPGTAGLLVGLFTEASLVVALAAHVASGLLYGGALWWLAHHGYLPFPEPS